MLSKGGSRIVRLKISKLPHIIVTVLDVIVQYSMLNVSMKQMCILNHYILQKLNILVQDVKEHTVDTVENLEFD